MAHSHRPHGYLNERIRRRFSFIPFYDLCTANLSYPYENTEWMRSFQCRRGEEKG